MKKIALLFVGAAALFAACDKDEEIFGVPGEGNFSGEEAVVEGYHHELTASVADENPASRAGFDLTDGTFHWLGGDDISVMNENNQFAKYTLKTGAGTASATFQTDAQIGTPQGYALHPHSASHSFDGTTLTFSLPTEYTYTHTADEYGAAPMVATFEADAANLQFKHVGGAFCFQMVGVPAGTTWFKFAANAQITGAFDVTEEDGNQIIKLNGSAASSVTINIPSSAEARDLTFYIPVPTGTYNGFTISVGNASETTWSYTSAATNTVNRKSLKKMPKVNLSASTAEAVADIFANGGVLTLTDNVTLDAEAAALTIPKGKSVVLDLNGRTISQGKEQSGGYSMIENKGTLTLKNGNIEYADNATLTAYINYVSNVIQNSGVLIIEEGVSVVNNSGSSVAEYGYPHAIDNSGTLIINGGTFTNNTNYSSLRIWCTTDDDTNVTINGGTFNGCIDLHNVNGQANKATLTINGGTFNGDTYTKSAVRLLGFGVDVDELNCYVKGGMFNMKVALNNYASGTFNSPVFHLSGGTFSAEAKENTVNHVNYTSDFLEEGYDFVENGDGTYTVKQQ